MDMDAKEVWYWAGVYFSILLKLFPFLILVFLVWIHEDIPKIIRMLSGSRDESIRTYMPRIRERESQMTLKDLKRAQLREERKEGDLRLSQGLRKRGFGTERRED